MIERHWRGIVRPGRADDDVAVAVVPEVARNMMVRFDPRVAHYEPVEGGEP